MSTCVDFQHKFHMLLYENSVNFDHFYNEEIYSFSCFLCACCSAVWEVKYWIILFMISPPMLVLKSLLWVQMSRDCTTEYLLALKWRKGVIYGSMDGSKICQLQKDKRHRVLLTFELFERPIHKTQCVTGVNRGWDWGLRTNEISSWRAQSFNGTGGINSRNSLRSVVSCRFEC